MTTTDNADAPLAANTKMPQYNGFVAFYSSTF